MTTDIVTAQLTSPGSYSFNEESLLHNRADGFMNDGEEGGADDQTQGMRLSKWRSGVMLTCRSLVAAHQPVSSSLTSGIRFSPTTASPSS